MSIDAGAIRQEKAFSLGQVPAWLCLGIGIYAVLLVSGNRLLNDSDTYWQISMGQWIIDHAALPRADTYSFTKAGEPWTSSSWLAQVLLASAYTMGGWGGVTALACKKSYPVYLDETAQLFDVISISAGMRGLQICLRPDDYIQAVSAQIASIAKNKT